MLEAVASLLKLVESPVFTTGNQIDAVKKLLWEGYNVEAKSFPENPLE